MSQQLIEVLRLKELLRCEMSNHNKFRAEVYSDPEFKAIIERREKERQAQHSEEYLDNLLDEVEGLELAAEVRF